VAPVVGSGLGLPMVGVAVGWAAPPQATAINEAAITRTMRRIGFTSPRTSDNGYCRSVRYQVFDDRIQIRGETDEHAAAAVMEVLRREKVTYSSLTGLGAVRWAKFAYYDATTKSYVEHAIEEQMEVISLVGNTTLRDGAPFIHWHVGLARHDMSMIGGHFLDAIIRPTLEIWLRRESAEVHRVFDEGSGLTLMELSERG
jgi:predicted DNA-binding protein with PD1-like motif